jgi:hypothetical protein
MSPRSEAIQKAIAFKAEYPTEKICTSARIHHANKASVCSNLYRRQCGDSTQIGG